MVRWLRLVLPRGSLVNHVPNEEVPRTLDPGVRAHVFQKRRAAGVLNGWPDIQATIPGGRIVFLEMKAPTGGVLSVEQQEIHRQLRALGHHVGVATDIETARGVMLAAGVALAESQHEPVRVAKSPRRARSPPQRRDPILMPRPMSGAQRAMAAKPTLRQIERANAAMMPPENPSKIVREGHFRGWHVRVYEPSWLPGGARFFMCADRVLPDGRPELGHDAEGETDADVDGWIRTLPMAAERQCAA